MIRVRKSGRRHHYSANPDVRLHHPVFQGRTLREIFGEMLMQGWLVPHKAEPETSLTRSATAVHRSRQPSAFAGVLVSERQSE